MTVITIVLIAALAAIATPLITSMITNAGKSSCCASAGGKLEGGTCKSLTSGQAITNYWDATNKKCM